MKKIIGLVFALVAILGLGYYAYSLSNENGTNDSELISFAIEDIDAVDRIIVSDSQGQKFEVIRNGKEWTEKTGACIQQEGVAFMLDAFKKIEFKGYLPENGRRNMLRSMIAKHTKVEIFQDGEWVKTWYIGPSAQDHMGQIMLLESEEFGKSDLPVLMKIQGVNGIIEPRFYADPKKWMCTNIFALKPEEISKVDMRFYQESFRSFSVENNHGKYKVSQLGKNVPIQDTTMVYRYLKNFEKVHFNIANYELNGKQVDSVKSSQPFAVLKVKETSGKTTKLKMFKIKDQQIRMNDFGQMEATDTDKFWCELSNGQLVKCQYFAFNPILMGNIYFPLVFPQVK